MPRLTVGVVQPSSLIFLVIVAIWVAYLIQHWVRRREHLATARSVDRFSEAMRVLERRSPLPATMLATSSSSGPSGSSARPAVPARAEVVAKRASVSSPLRARHGAASSAGADGADSTALGGPVHPVAPIELVPHRTTLQVVLRRVRGILFLAALVAVPVTIVLSAAHILKWLSLTLAVTALVAVVVWLRVAAIQEQKARRARRAELRRLERLRAGDVSMVRASQRSPQSSRQRSSVPSVRRAEPAVFGTTADPATGPDVLAAAPEPVAAPAARAVDPDAWQPVPVPPPTYTLKEPAHRPERVAPSSPAAQRPVPIEVEDDEIEVMAALHGRRVVGR